MAKFVAIIPGQTPSIPRPFVGAAATAAVAVPCSSSTGARADRRDPAALELGVA